MSAAAKSVDHVRNDDVKKLFQQEKELVQRLADIRGKVKDLRTERDSVQQSELPKKQKELDAMDEKINKLRIEKDELYKTLSEDTDSRISRMARMEASDHLRMVRMTIEPLERELLQLVEELDDKQKKAEKLQVTVQQLKTACGGKNAANMASQVASLQKKLQKETEKGNDALAKSIKKDIRQMESEKVKAEAYHVKNQTLKAMAAEIGELAKKADEKTPELQKLRKQKDEYEEKLKNLGDVAPVQKKNDEDRKAERKAEDERRNKTREVIKQIQAKIEKCYEDKNDMFATGKSKELDEKMKKLVSEREDLEAKVKSLNDKIPRNVVDIDAENIFDLVGPGGATVKQIEEDFGVVIDVKRQEGQAVIRGTDCEDCAEAVKSIIEMAKENRHEEHMQIDKDVSGEFIGTGGSQIQLLQSQSGCNINFTRETGAITIIGNKENIAKAVALINDFKSSSFRTELKFNDSAVPFLRGNLMRQWQELYGCRLIRLDRDSKTISIIGQEENVKKAQKEISEFVKGAGSAAVIPIPSTVPHFIIIGTKGERVRSIEAETSCILDVKQEMVKVAGTPENIERAKKLLNTLIAENIRDEAKIPYKTKMHNYLTRRRPAKVVEEHVDPNAEATSPKEPKELCILEVLRLKHNCDRVQADMRAGQIYLRGPKDGIKKCISDINDALNFVGMEKEMLELENAVVRYLCLNLTPPGQRGVTTRLDAVRSMEGVEEVSADFRGESKKVEIIGTKEGVAAAKEKLLSMAKDIEDRMAFMEIEAGKVGFLLGSGGRNVRKIEEDFGVMFHIPRTNRDGPKEDVVKVSIVAEDASTLTEAKDEAERTMNTRY